MMDYIFQVQIPIFFLILSTWLLVFKDRAFNAIMRVDFFMMLALSGLLLLINSLTHTMNLSMREQTYIMQLGKMVLRPFVLMIWLGIVLRGQSKNKKRFYATPILALINAFLCIVSIWNGWVFTLDVENQWQGGDLYLLPQMIYVIYILLILGCSIMNARKEDTMEHIVIAVLAVGILAAANMEFSFSVPGLLDSFVTISVCVYYFYLITQVYKLDALTHIMNRHNLLYDLEELEEKEYYITMVDIDNFKSINDRYGHDKGDEALKLVAKIIKKSMPKKSKLYRYGGDEFAVVSRATTEKGLTDIFERINEELKNYDYRISYGTYKHSPGDKSNEIIKIADRLMYENKRAVKSESIWDDMTGLFNLRGFLEELEMMKKQATKESKEIRLIAFDVEHLGHINLAYGYAEGNMVITTLSNIIKRCIDNNGIVGHLGSDEFVVAIKSIKEDASQQESIVMKVLTGIQDAQELENKEYTIEINSAVHIIDPNNASSMEKEVNEVLYQKQVDKESRRKSFTSFSYDDQEIDEEEEATALEIINRNRLKYAFQPIVSAKDGTIVAYEALMRSDTEPMMSPMTILRHAKNNKRYDTIEKLTFNNVLKAVKNNQEVLKDRRVFLNSIPGFMLKDEDYAEVVEKYGEFMNQIVIEINEQSELGDEELTMIRNRQKQEGFGIALDDYGSGNANTYSLLRIKPEIIKLDRLLITDIDRNTKKQYFVNSIITFAKENGMRVLAEGVETEAELKMVIRLRADYIQGYYTAKPSLEIVEHIAEDVKRCIVSENIKGSAGNKRKVYMASAVREISLVQLALEEYTGIVVSVPELTILGNTDYLADMNIKIKDGIDCVLKLRNVKLNAVDDCACVDVGEDTNLTIQLLGDCTFEQRGVFVPESASVIIEGDGNLTISARGIDCYGIGCGADKPVGAITLNHQGLLSIDVEGERGVAIGGGKYRTGEGISLLYGKCNLRVNGDDAIGVGCLEGEIPIRQEEYEISM